MDSGKPWEQQENEPNRWFQRFERFRLMGPGRSIEGVWKAEESGGKRPGKAWYKYSGEFCWNARADAWDRHITAQAAAELEAKWRAQIVGELEVLALLSGHARGDMGDFLDITPMGFVVDLDKAQEKGLTHLIKKVKMRTQTSVSKEGIETETHDTEIELYDAQAAAVHMGRHYKLFTDKLDIGKKTYHVTLDGEELEDE